MMRRLMLTATVLVCLAVQAVPHLWAAEAIVGVIPEDALGFVVVNRIGDVDAKIHALGKKMQLHTPNLPALLEAMAYVEDALDDEGSAALVVLPGDGPNAEPGVFVLMPVVDYGNLMEQLEVEDSSAKIAELDVGGASILLGNRAGYAVIGRPSDREGLEKLLDAPQHVAADVVPMQQWLADGDMGLVLTRRGVELLAELGQLTLQQTRETLSSLSEEQQIEGIEAAVSVFTVYEQIIEALAEEVNNYALVIEIDDDGNLCFEERLRVNPGGRLSEVLAEVEAPSYDLLAGLPAGPYVFAGGGILTEAMGEELMSFSAAVMKATPELYGFDPEQVDQMIEASRQSMKGFRGMSMSMGVGEVGDPISGGFAIVEKVDDTDAFMADYVKNIETMNDLMEESTESMFSGYSVEEIELDNTPALKLTMEIPVPPTAADIPEYDEIMGKIFGPDRKISVYIAAADKETIVASYMNQDLLLQCMKVVRGEVPGLESDPNLAKTMALLPEDGNWVGCFSINGAMDFVKRTIAAFVPEGEDVPQLPEFSESPPIAFSSKATAEGVTLHTVVPAEIFEAIGELVAELNQDEQ